MAAYYNEFNPQSAHILRQLIKDGLVASGDVDERPIQEVTLDDLRGYKQHHFFAGIGGWSTALRLAGWPDDKPVWTGSCPCQPFSSAGRQKGKADERHLWPVWFSLISQYRPTTIFGEQVATAITYGWLDDVYEGLEAEGYAIGSAVLPACSVGSPHKRDRLWFVGNAELPRPHESQKFRGVRTGEKGGRMQQSKRSNTSSNVADTNGEVLQGHRRFEQRHDSQGREVAQRYPWQSGVWIGCPDGKKRVIEPSIPLLAHGVQHRNPIIHALGNAIVPQVAAEFIRAAKQPTEE
ncbi:DNA cytosine methyltransferase [uncultured Paraglaciecola sp.]|uniref:DNA cytosine methyltransferase n=1 Tax=uncultured Paraglaciecola sp. TaxID=1765024 RepID=UPI002627F854|nr:DNA cytosine methyltransferase [uncultured Paraglaciecola sp.]